MIAQIAYLIAARTDNSRSGGGKKIDTHTHEARADTVLGIANEGNPMHGGCDSGQRRHTKSVASASTRAILTTYTLSIVNYVYANHFFLVSVVRSVDFFLFTFIRFEMLRYTELHLNVFAVCAATAANGLK